MFDQIGTTWGVVEVKTQRLPLAGRVALVDLAGQPWVNILVPNVDLDSVSTADAPLADRTAGRGFANHYVPLRDVTRMTEMVEEDARAEAVGIAFADLCAEELAKKQAQDAAVLKDVATGLREQNAKKAAERFAALDLPSTVPRKHVGTLHGSEVCPHILGHRWHEAASHPKQGEEPEHEAEKMNLAVWLECAFCPAWAELADI